MTIHLGTAVVAGLFHYVDKAWLEKHVVEGDPIRLVREPMNPHDHHAIEVKHLERATSHLEKLGYIPAAQNAVFAALLDAGFPLVATVDTVEARSATVVLSINLSEKRGKLARLKAAQKILAIVRPGVAKGDTELNEAFMNYDGILDK